MIPELLNPVSVTHMGRGVVFAASRVPDGDHDEYWYNVLQPGLDSGGDVLDWTGWSRLDHPPGVTQGGADLVRVDRAVHTRGPFQAVSDGQYLYLFRAGGGSLYAQRYLMVAVPAAREEERPRVRLDPAWEVRFQRSGSPSLPSGERDTPGFLDPQGRPYLAPVRELLLGGAGQALPRVEDFAVALAPANTEAERRWQLFVRDAAGGRLHCYSLPRQPDGWFGYPGDRTDAGTGTLLPDAVLALRRGADALSASGPPGVTGYLKQETVGRTSRDEAVRMTRAHRVLVALPVEGGGRAGLATLDFAVAADGRLAMLRPRAPGELVLDLETPRVEPADFALAFGREAWGEIPTGPPLVLSERFTLEAWVRPEGTEGVQPVFGWDPAQPEDRRPPSLWLTDRARVGVGFGDGAGAFRQDATRDNVLTPRTWNHVAAVWDGTRMRVYVNAAEVPLRGDGLAGARPAAVPLSTLGGRPGGAGPGEFLDGVLDEARVWSTGRTAEELRQWLFREIPDPAAVPALAGYWRLDDGAGDTAHDASSGGRTVRLFGTRWEPANAPVRPASEVGEYVDGDGLTLETGVILPDPGDRFGAVAPGTRPWLLDGADGMVHLYYRGTDGDLIAAQLDTTTGRAVLRAEWAVPGGARGGVLFSARQTGSVMNGLSVSLTADGRHPGLLCGVDINDQRGMVEAWRGVPCRMDAFLKVLGGQAVAEPADPRLAAGDRVFFDYPGTRPQALVPVGDQAQGASVRFASLPLEAFALREVHAASGPQGVEVKLVFASSAARAEERLTRTLRDVPAGVDAFVQTLAGLNPRYDYEAGGAGDGGGTRVYTLRAGGAPMLAFVPDPEVTEVAMEVAPAADPLRCTLRLAIRRASGDPLEETVELPRQAGGFAAELEAKGGPAAPLLRLHVPAPEALVEDQEARTPAGPLAFLALFAAWADGARAASVPGFAVTLAPLQGAPDGARRASRIVSVRALAVPADAAAPPAVAVPAPATLFRPGEDGGWTPEPPRWAVRLDGLGALNVPVSTPPQASLARLAVPGPLTLEAWVLPRVPAPVAGQERARHPRVLQANAGGARFMLGLTSTYALQFQALTTVRTNDGAGAAQRLVPSDEYTLQFWVRANLPTMADWNLLLDRAEANAAGADRIDVHPDGTLRYLAVAGSDEGTLRGTIASQAWTRVTVTRAGRLGTLYLDGAAVGSDDRMPAVPAGNSLLKLGDNPAPRALEMEMNQLAIWGRALSAEEVAAAGAPVRGDDGDLRLLWPLDEGPPAIATANAALATAGLFPGIISWQGAQPRLWEYPGLFYRAFAAVGDRAVRTRQALVSPAVGDPPPDTASASWAHVAALYEPHFALRMDGRSWGDCGDDDSLNVSDALTLEAWVAPDAPVGGERQVVFSKFGAEPEGRSYELGLDGGGRPYLTVQLDGTRLPADQRLRTWTSPTAIVPGAVRHVAATVTVETRPPSTNPDVRQTKTTFRMVAQLYVDGQPTLPLPAPDAGWGEDPLSIRQSKTRANIGRTLASGLEGAGFFRGRISDLRLWNRALPPAVVLRSVGTRQSAPADQGLVSAWYFTEQAGRQAADAALENNADLGTSTLWDQMRENATLGMMVNGSLVAVEEATVGGFGGYGAPQVRLGDRLDERGIPSDALVGVLDEVRVWSELRTPEQVTDNMNRYLSGSEAHLAAYWLFDAGSGRVVVDGTGGGNDAVFEAEDHAGLPRWVPSTAPIGNEGPAVLNALGGIRTAALARPTGSPTAFEYGDLQRDSRGELVSVLKRAYVYPQAGRMWLDTGYKVGELDRTYVGQVQTAPRLIGFIEGAPPLPAENMVRPEKDAALFADFFDLSRVTLTDADSVRVSFSATRDEGMDAAFGLKAGLQFGLVKGEVVGVGVAVQVQTTKLALSAGLGVSLNWSASHGSGTGLATQATRTRVNQLASRGWWEPADVPALRRFRPANEGYALVKSATADVYALRIRGSGALVALSVVPNLNIPEDFNVIHFPIAPRYVRNGTLDGKVGLRNDPSYPDADVRRGSYFRPVEAATLDRRIERQRQELMARYGQFNARSRALSLDADLSDAAVSNPFYDWSSGTPRRDLSNSYVWTSAGGLRSESETFTVVRQETHGGQSSLGFSAGAELSLETEIFGVGFSLEANAEFGMSWTVNVEKEQEDESRFELSVNAAPDGFLGAYPVTAEPDYSPDAVPGKVDAYRFKTYFLAPRESFLDDFYDVVADPVWMRTSGSAAAAALLEARDNSRGAAVWRVMHRVTYVSRVPPRFQPLPEDTVSPGVAEPANLAQNRIFVSLITSALPERPTPAEIGARVRQVVMHTLRKAIPWWDAFLEEAQVPNSPAADALRRILDEGMAYMNEFYRARALAPPPAPASAAREGLLSLAPLLEVPVAE